MWRVACYRSLVEPAGIAIVLVRGVSSPAFIRGRRRHTKKLETAKNAGSETPANARKHAESQGNTRKGAGLRNPAELGSLADMATMTDAEPDLHTVREAAALADVTTRSIYNWIKAGRLTEYKTLGGGKRLVDLNELRRNLRP